MRSIKNEKNLNNKKILLRLDLNVPLDKGKIVSEGTHEQLINKKGLYAKLAKLQFLTN